MDVVDLAIDPNVAGPVARSTTRKFRFDRSLAIVESCVGIFQGQRACTVSSAIKLDAKTSIFYLYLVRRRRRFMHGFLLFSPCSPRDVSMASSRRNSVSFDTKPTTRFSIVHSLILRSDLSYLRPVLR